MAVTQSKLCKEQQLILTIEGVGLLLIFVLGLSACDTKSPDRHESSPHQVVSDSVIRIDSSFMRKVTLTPTSQSTEIVDIQDGQIRIPGPPYDTYGRIYHDSTTVCFTMGSSDNPLIRVERQTKAIEYPRLYGDVVYWYHQVGSVVIVGSNDFVRYYNKTGIAFDSSHYMNNFTAAGTSIVLESGRNSLFDFVTVDTSTLSISTSTWKLDWYSNNPSSVRDLTVYTQIKSGYVDETDTDVELEIEIQSSTWNRSLNVLVPERQAIHLRVPTGVSNETHRTVLLGSDDQRIVFVLCAETDERKLTDYLVVCERDGSMAKVYMIPSTMRRTLWKRAQYDHEMDMYIVKWPSGVGYHVDDDLQMLLLPGQHGEDYHFVSLT